MPRINEELLTAYALDELPLSTRMEVKAYLAHHPEAELAVQAIQAAADQLRDELMTEIEQTPRPTVAPMRLRHPVRRPAAQWRVPIAVAASVAAVLGTFGALMYQARVGPVSDVAIRAEGERVARGTGPAQKLEEGPSVTGDVTRRSYADVLAQQMESPLPPPNLDFEAATPNTGWKQPGGAFGVATPAPAEPMVGMGAGTYGGKGKSYGVGSADGRGVTAPFGTPSVPKPSAALAKQGQIDDLNSAAKREAEESARQIEAINLQLTAANGKAAENEKLIERLKLQLAQRRTETSDAQHGTEGYNAISDNSFLAVAENPLSTFSIDVDTASYSNIRRFLSQGQLPPKDAVRIEEMVNYFPYSYEGPGEKDKEKPFAASVEIAACPWNTTNRLVRVGIKGREVKQDQRPPSNLVFLIDVSGSMRDMNKLPLVRQSLRELVNKLDARDRVAIVVYAGSSGLVLPSTPAGDADVNFTKLWHQKYAPMIGVDSEGKPKNEEAVRRAYIEEMLQLRDAQQQRKAILASIDRLESGGSTNGGAGIELAYSTAQSAFIKGGTNRVILCTDGDFNVGITDQNSLSRLIEEKAKGGVFLSVLGFGMGNTKDNTMETLADKGNGNYAYIDDLPEAKKVLVDQMTGTLVTIAKDVKIQVEFNPAKVQSYRLIGYENRILAREDFNNDKKDAGEIGAGHTVTAMYEVVPAGARPPAVDALKYATNPVTNDNAEMLTLKLRYKAPDAPLEQGTSKLLEFPITDSGKGYAQASGDFKFAAAVAGFGMVLRDSPHKGTASYASVLELGAEGKGEDAKGYRAEFLKMVEQAKAISGR